MDAVLAEMSKDFDGLYSQVGRPLIAPERLLRALLLQVFYSVRSERLLMEQLNYNLLFRWFVGLEIDDGVWNHAVFSKNRDRLLNQELAQKFFAHVKEHFIGVHQMLDPQAAKVNELIDQLAERITTLGGSPDGRSGSIVKQRNMGRLLARRPRSRRRALGRARPRLRRRDRVAPQGDRCDREARSGHAGRPDRADRGAGALPLVRARASRGRRRPPGRHRRPHREARRRERAPRDRLPASSPHARRS